MHRDNRCMYMAHVCFYVCYSDCVGVCGNVCCVAGIVGNIFKPWSVEACLCLCRGCDRCCVFCLNCKAWNCMCLCIGKCECFVMQMLCVLCVSCGSSQCCVLHDFQFVNTARGCKRQLYGIGILQSRSHDCLVSSHECPPVCPMLLR